MLGLGSLESLLNLGRDQQRLGADESRQLGPDLLQSAAISFPLFKEKSGHFGIGFEVGFGVVLDLQVHHFLDEFDQRFGMHIRSYPDKHPLTEASSPDGELVSRCQAISVVAPVRFPGKN